MLMLAVSTICQQFFVFRKHIISQLRFTCSKAPIEALEKGVKFVQN